MGVSTVLLKLQHCIRSVDFGVDTDGVTGVSGAPPFSKHLEVDIVKQIGTCQLLCNNLSGISVVESISNELWCIFLTLWVVDAWDTDYNQAALLAIARLEHIIGLQTEVLFVKLTENAHSIETFEL